MDKKCIECKVPWSVQLFYRGNDTRCKRCHRESVKRWAREHPEIKKASDLAWRERNRKEIAERGKEKRKRLALVPGYKEKEYARMSKWHQENPVKSWLSACKARAKKFGIEFDNDISDIVVPDVCPILGIILQRGEGYGPSDNSPSLDKMIPALGYVKGNRWVISNRANKIKSDASLEELVLVGKWAQEEIIRRG